MNKSQNKTLNESKNNNVELFLFEVFEAKKYTYIGSVILDQIPFEEKQLDTNNNERDVWVFPLKLIESPQITIDKSKIKKLEEIKEKKNKKNEISGD